jgi:hypothetical protein
VTFTRLYRVGRVRRVNRVSRIERVSRGRVVIRVGGICRVRSGRGLEGSVLVSNGQKGQESLMQLQLLILTILHLFACSVPLP